MWSVIGQDKAVSLLQRSLETGSLAHAYLFIGPAHVGKMTLALNMIQALNCESSEPPCGQCNSCRKVIEAKHADVQVIGLNGDGDSSASKQKTEISIDRIREIQHSANLPPFEGKYSTYIIDGAEFLSIEAANCLLKTLEEPADNVVFILLTANEQLLPMTVISRCQRVELPPLSADKIEYVLSSNWGIESQEARLLARLSNGCLGWAVSAHLDSSFLEQRNGYLDELIEVIETDLDKRFAYAVKLAAQFSQNRAVVQEQIGTWISWWRDMLLVKTGCVDYVTNIDRLAILNDMVRSYSINQIQTFIKDIQAAGEQLKQNANPRLVLEVLMLNIPAAVRTRNAGSAA
jgi:DNA polymerase-3 subunit delta'